MIDNIISNILFGNFDSIDIIGKYSEGKYYLYVCLGNVERKLLKWLLRK